MQDITIPGKIQVGGHWYEVRFVKNLIRDTGNRGQVTWHTQSVEIDDNMPESITSQVFWHECKHLVDKHYNNDSLAEDAVASMAEGEFQVLQGMGIRFVR